MEFIVILIFIVLVVLYLNNKDQRMEKEREKEKQRKIKEEALLKEQKEQEKIRQEVLAIEKQKKDCEQRINAIIDISKLLSQNLSERVNSTKKTLDDAEREYRDGAYNPFWDAIEQVVTNLAYFNEDINQITRYCATYQAESRRLGSPPPPFDWERATNFPDAAVITSRLQRIVRSAQKNPWFALTYNQIKTNRILVAGFTGLGQALSEIAYRIDESTAALSTAVADLSFTVSDASTQAIEASREDARAIMESMRVIRKQTKAEAEIEAEARREHEQREQEMLDNIQRGEKPSFPDYRGHLR